MSAHRKRRPRVTARRAATVPAVAQTSAAEASGVRELARLLHKSPATISGWTNRPDWPFGLPPWPVESVRGWASIALSPDPAAAMRDRLAQAERAAAAAGDAPTAAEIYEQRARAELLQIVARTRLLLQEHDAKAGKLHDVEACAARRIRQIHAVKETLLALGRRLAPRLVGLTRDEIEGLILAEVTGACNSFAGDSGAELNAGTTATGTSGAAAAPPACGRHPDATAAAGNPAREAAPQ